MVSMIQEDGTETVIGYFLANLSAFNSAHTALLLILKHCTTIYLGNSVAWRLFGPTGESSLDRFRLEVGKSVKFPCGLMMAWFDKDEARITASGSGLTSEQEP